MSPFLNNEGTDASTYYGTYRHNDYRTSEDTETHIIIMQKVISDLITQVILRYRS